MMWLKAGYVSCASLALVIGTFGCDSKSESKPAGNSSAAPTAAPTAQPVIPQVQMIDWCPEHGVPESICTRCNDSLVSGFKAKNDWCKEHDLPESQCFICHPELKAQFAAQYKAKYGKEPPATQPNS